MAEKIKVMKVIYVHRLTAALLSELVMARRSEGRRPSECTRDAVVWDALNKFIEEGKDDK